MPTKIDVIGMQFGFWTVIDFVYSHKASGRMYRCRCICGNESIKSAGCLRQLAETASCGCRYNQRRPKIHFNHSSRRLRKILTNVKSRCYNENATSYARYGGRGISVCQEWVDNFSSFREWAVSNGYEDNLTLDRIDNDGPYSPENCRWASPKDQMRNMSRNRRIRGKTIAEWSEELGIANWVLRNRLLRGWSDDRILSEPVNEKKGISS